MLMVRLLGSRSPVRPSLEARFRLADSRVRGPPTPPRNPAGSTSAASRATVRRGRSRRGLGGNGRGVRAPGGTRDGAAAGPAFRARAGVVRGGTYRGGGGVRHRVPDGCRPGGGVLRKRAGATGGRGPDPGAAGRAGVLGAPGESAAVLDGTGEPLRWPRVELRSGVRRDGDLDRGLFGRLRARPKDSRLEVS